MKRIFEYGVETPNKDLEINTYTIPHVPPENQEGHELWKLLSSPRGLVSADITLNKSIPETSEIEKIHMSPLGFSQKKIRQELCCVHDRNMLKVQVEDVFIKVARMILNKIEDGGVAHALIRKWLGTSRMKTCKAEPQQTSMNHNETTKKKSKKTT